MTSQAKSTVRYVSTTHEACESADGVDGKQISRLTTNRDARSRNVDRLSTLGLVSQATLFAFL